MFPSEMVILMAIAVARGSGRKLVVPQMDVAGEYVAYLYGSLVRRGYLSGNSSKGYQLTSQGRGSLFQFLHENETRVKETMKTLQQLGIEIGQERDKIGKDVVGVK